MPAQTQPLTASGLPLPQLVLALLLAVSMLAIVIELVRRRKLREEYAALWIGTAALLTVLALQTRVLFFLADLVGAQSPVSVLFFGAHVFLMLVALQFSVRLTKLGFRNKTLSQKIALLEHQVEELRREVQQQATGPRREVDAGEAPRQKAAQLEAGRNPLP